MSRIRDAPPPANQSPAFHAGDPRRKDTNPSRPSDRPGRNTPAADPGRPPPADRISHADAALYIGGSGLACSFFPAPSSSRGACPPCRLEACEEAARRGMPASPPFPLLFPLLGGFEFEKASLLSWLLAAVRVCACFDFELRGLGAGRVRAPPRGVARQRVWGARVCSADLLRFGRKLPAGVAGRRSLGWDWLWWLGIVASVGAIWVWLLRSRAELQP